MPIDFSRNRTTGGSPESLSGREPLEGWLKRIGITPECISSVKSYKSKLSPLFGVSPDQYETILEKNLKEIGFWTAADEMVKTDLMKLSLPPDNHNLEFVRNVAYFVLVDGTYGMINQERGINSAGIIIIPPGDGPHRGSISSDFKLGEFIWVAYNSDRDLTSARQNPPILILMMHEAKIKTTGETVHLPYAKTDALRKYDNIGKMIQVENDVQKLRSYATQAADLKKRIELLQEA
jgi:hypothetical protein